MFPHHPCTGSPALGPLWKALQKEAVVPALPWATVQPGQPEESSVSPHQQWPWGQQSQKQQRCSFSIRGSQPRLQQQPLLEQPASGEEGKVTARTCSLAHLRRPWGTAELTRVSEGGWYLSLTHGRGWASWARFFLPKWSYGLQTLVMCTVSVTPPAHRLSASSTWEGVMTGGTHSRGDLEQVLVISSVTTSCGARTLGDFSLLLISLSSFYLFIFLGGRGVFFYTAKLKFFS